MTYWKFLSENLLKDFWTSIKIFLLMWLYCVDRAKALLGSKFHAENDFEIIFQNWIFPRYAYLKCEIGQMMIWDDCFALAGLTAKFNRYWIVLVSWRRPHLLAKWARKLGITLKLIQFVASVLISVVFSFSSFFNKLGNFLFLNFASLNIKIYAIM